MRTGQPASEASGVPGIPDIRFRRCAAHLRRRRLPATRPARAATPTSRPRSRSSSTTLSLVRGRPQPRSREPTFGCKHLDVLQPPSPTGNFQFTNIFTAGSQPPARRSPTPATASRRSCSARCSRFSIDAQPRSAQAARHDRRVLRAGRLARHLAASPSTSASATRSTSRPPWSTIGRRLQPRKPRSSTFSARTASRAPPAIWRRTTSARASAWPSRSPTRSSLRSGYGLTWIEQAGITTPFTTPLFPFIQTLGQQIARQHQSGLRSLAGPDRRQPQPPDADAGLGQGVFGVQRDNGSGYAQQWNLTLQKTFGENWSVEAGYLGSKLTRLGVPDVNLNQLRVEQLALGSHSRSRSRIPTSARFRPIIARRPTIARQQLLRPYPRFTTVTLYRNNIGHSTYHSFQSRLEKRFSARPHLHRRLHVLAPDRRRRRRLRLRRAHRPGRQLPGRRQLQQAPGEGCLHRQRAAHLLQRLRVRTALRAWLADRRHRRGCSPAVPIAVTQATNLNAFAGFGIQRPNRIADPRPCPPISAPPPAGSTPRPSPRRRNSRSATARAIPSRVPAIAPST